ncbi:uncharacterized protein C15orf39 homolog isoform X2 [Rhinatrema bivittatum]|uniref:uncharacterized protein C15orf39 homolog isoform X2 n=1 Tax=Rhinatrema bivittatum TaxID=194408 RepID=UPI00112768EF|nr:uncharacterized protein C15orf39 homolog isoform X2 [Rhinatrema bivittatum]
MSAVGSEGEFIMAGKRQLNSLDPVMYNKLPRLEIESDHAITTGLCKPNSLPGYGPENLLGYKGAYVTYALQTSEGSELPHPWSPAAAYLQYAGNALNQRLRTEGALKGLCYRPEAQSLKAGLQPTGAEKGKEEIVRDLLIRREKWANFMGQQDQLRQAQAHAFSLQKPVAVNSTVSPAPAGCAPLAVPKPVYRNPVCYVDSGYNSGTPLSLGSQRENKQKQQVDREWTQITPAAPGHLIHPSDHHYGVLSAMQKKPQQLESSFPSLQQGFGVYGKDTGRPGVDYITFQPAFENPRTSHSSSFPETKYPAMYENQKRVPEMHHSSPTPKSWTSLHSATSNALAHSQVPVFHDRSPPHYPMTSHGQTLLYHPGDPLAGKQDGSMLSLQPTSSYKAFSSGTSESKPLPGSYFNQQIPKSHYPNSLEHYPYRSTVPTSNEAPVHLPVEFCNVKPGVTHGNSEIQHNFGFKQDFLQPNPNFAFASSDVASYNNAVLATDLHFVQPGNSNISASSYGTPPAKECPRGQQISGPHSAFQPVYASGTSANCSEKLADGLLSGEASYISCPLEREKPTVGRQESSNFERRPSLTMEELKPRKMLQEASSMAPVVVASPTSQHSKEQTPRRGDCRLNPLETQATPSMLPCVHQSTKEKPAKLRSTENSSPSSPPMPVINNVFSLAPYREYLEGSAVHPFTKDDSGAESSTGSLKHDDENKGGGDPSPQSLFPPPGVRYPEKPSEQPACRTELHTIKANAGEKVRLNSSAGGSRKSHEGRPSDICEAAALPPNLPRHSQPAHEGLKANDLKLSADAHGSKLQRNNEVLDLSLKKNASATWNRTASVTSRFCEGHVQDYKVEKRYDSLKAQEMYKGYSPQTLTPETENNPPSDRTFHSSASFMFKKYKILKPASQAGETSCSQNALPAQQKLQVLRHPNPQPLLVTSFKMILPELSNSLPPSAPESSPTLAEASVSLPSSCESAQNSSGQYFTDLHLSLCMAISTCVSESSLELLQEWLSKTEPDEESKERPRSPNKHKNGSRVSNVLKASKSREIWMYFEGVPALFSKLLSQLETFMFIRNCPFPHVVRAGAIFIPIHLVKEKLFPELPAIFVDRVLQKHRVELRPTTLSEEKLLRDSELKNCPSKMLKLLALKQLPDIYPDLLDLLWHNYVEQQLGSSSQAGLHASK